MFGAANPNGGSNQGIAEAASDLLSEPRAMLGINEEGEMWAVLLNRTAGHDNRAHPSVKRCLDLGPSQSLQE